jgi:hypothetical protein
VPFTFLAHQAPVLPLKLWRPRWFSGAGRVIGSMAPDFEKFIGGANAGRDAHSLAAQFTYCLPLSLVIYWLLTRVAAPPLARFLPELGALRLRDYPTVLAADRRREWLCVAVSILIGSTSHVAFDGFTHGDPRVLALFPFLGQRAVTLFGRTVWLFTVLQVGASVVAGAFTLALLYAVGRRRRALAWAGLDAGRVAPRAERSPAAAAYWITVAVVTAALTAALALFEVARADGLPAGRLAYAVALQLPLTGFAALCVAGLASRRRGAPAAAPAPDLRARAASQPRSHSR